MEVLQPGAAVTFAPRAAGLHGARSARAVLLLAPASAAASVLDAAVAAEPAFPPSGGPRVRAEPHDEAVPEVRPRHRLLLHLLPLLRDDVFFYTSYPSQHRQLQSQDIVRVLFSAARLRHGQHVRVLHRRRRILLLLR